MQALAGVFFLLVALRAALPYAARKIAIQKADELLIGRAEIADVDFALFKGVVTLHGLRVYARDAEPVKGTQLEPASRAAPAKSPERAAPVAQSGEAPGQPSTGDAPVEQSTAVTRTPSIERDAPFLSAEHVTLNLAWLALLEKLVEVQAFEVETLDVNLDRARDGTLVLPRPVPSAEAPPPAAEDKEPSGWGVLIDRVTLRNGQVAFRDYAVSDTPETITASIPNLDADHLALLITDTGTTPGTMVLDAALGEGTLRLESSLRNVEGGTSLESHVMLANLPIGDARAYIPKVGWTSLDGRLDVDLVHRFDPNETNSIRGSLDLRDATIGVDGISEPALTCTKLAVGIDALDLAKQDARIASVAIDGLQVIAQPAGAEPLPLLRGLVAKAGETVTKNVTTEPARAAAQDAAPAASEPAPEASKDAAPATGSEDGPPEPKDAAPGAPTSGAHEEPTAAAPAAPTEGVPAESTATAPAASAESVPMESESPAAATVPGAQSTPPAPSRPWTWTVQRVVVTNGAVETFGGDGPLEVKIRAEATPISSKLQSRTKIDVTLAPPQGSLALTGEMALDPLAFDGKLHIDALALAPLTQPVATPLTRLLHRATLATDLDVALGAGTKAPKEGARIAGKVSVTDLEIAGDDPKLFALRWTDFSIDANEILLPGILAKQSATPPPIDVALASVSLVRPKIVVLRTPKGINLPEAFTGSASAPAPSGAAASATASNAAASSSAPQISLRADHVSIAQLRVTITDKSVDPVYHSSIDPLDLEASDFRWPGPYAKDIDVHAKGLDGAILEITGQVSPEGSQLVGTLDGLPLAPLDPYAVAAGYGLGGGTAALRSRVTTGPSSYQTKNRITLNRLALTGTKGDSLFAAQFGMPLSLALGLMTDLEGNIVLSIPIGGNRAGTSIAVGTVIRDALAHAILNAATSPLKLIGAVANIGEKPASLVPPPLAFAPGQVVLAESENTKLEQLAKVLAKSPRLKLELRGETSDADSRWIAEQALRAKLEDESGVLGSLRHMTERDERAEAVEVLGARAEGKSADMPAEHQAWLDAQVARFPVADEKLLDLATQRANWVRSQLAKDGALQARVAVVPANPEDLGSRSVVALTFATVQAEDEAAEDKPAATKDSQERPVRAPAPATGKPAR